MTDEVDILRRLCRVVVRLAVVSFALTYVSACDFRQPVCVSDSECRANFVCSSSSGYCEPDWDAVSQAEPEPDVAEEDTRPEEDTDDGGEDTGQDSTFVPSACVGEDDDRGCSSRGEKNDSRIDAAELTASGFGCTGETTDFRELDTVKGAGLCGDDTVDYYSLEYVECRDRSFRIDVILDPHPETCPHEIYSLRMVIDGETFECSPDQSVSNSSARCTVLRDGGRQLTAYIDSQSRPSVKFATIVVESEAEVGSAFFNYDMRVRLF